MTKAEFIESRQAEALIVDEDMRRAASIIHERLWGSPLELASRHNPDEWAKCDHTYWYFDQLAMKYAYAVLGDRRLKRRPLFEAIFLHVILLSSIGRSASFPLLAGEFSGFSFGMLNPRLKHGLERLQKSLETLRQRYFVFEGLPRTYEDFFSPGKTFRQESQGVWTYIRVSSTWDEDSKDAFAERILAELDSVRNEWSIPDPRCPIGQWLFQDLDLAVL